MGLFSGRPAIEERDAFPYPAIPPNSQVGTTSIRRVDLSRTNTAMGHVGVYSAVNLIASMAEIVPLRIYSQSVDNEIPMPRWLADLGGQGHGIGDFTYQLMYCWGLRGNVVGQVPERDNTGKPRIIDIVHPDQVKLSGNSGSPDWYLNGQQVDNPKETIFHRRVFPMPGAIMGMSPIALHATTIGLGLMSKNFGAQWFLDGAHPSAILSNDEMSEIGATAAMGVKQRFLQAVRGTREPVVLGKGWKYQQIQIAPAESQFLETQEWTAAECARIYGPGMPAMLGYKTGGSMTYANIEQRAVDLLVYSLDPWLVRAERLFTSLLPAPQFAQFDRKALLRSDTKTRYEANQIALKNGWRTINEIRKDEGDAPVPWGDEPFTLTPATPEPAADGTDGAGNPGGNQ